MASLKATNLEEFQEPADASYRIHLFGRTSLNEREYEREREREREKGRQEKWANRRDRAEILKFLRNRRRSRAMPKR